MGMISADAWEVVVEGLRLHLSIRKSDFGGPPQSVLLDPVETALPSQNKLHLVFNQGIKAFLHDELNSLYVGTLLRGFIVIIVIFRSLSGMAELFFFAGKLQICDRIVVRLLFPCSILIGLCCFTRILEHGFARYLILTVSLLKLKA